MVKVTEFKPFPNGSQIRIWVRVPRSPLIDFLVTNDTEQRNGDAVFEGSHGIFSPGLSLFK